MRERMDMSHGLPSFSPEWEHPVCPPPWGHTDKDVIVATDGGYWKQEALTGEAEPMFTCVRRDFVGFRLVRAS